MDSQTEIIADELASSEEMQNFYRILAAVQTNAIFNVMSGKDAEEMRELAKREAERLYSLFPGKCQFGQVWDPKNRSVYRF